jgi:hypothetical protein
MNLRQMASLVADKPPDKIASEALPAERCLTLLAEGVALNVPEIDEAAHKQLRASVGQLALQIPDRASTDEKLIQIRTILHEFEVYRQGVENALRQRQAAWRALADKLLRELLTRIGIEVVAPEASSLLIKIPALVSAEDLAAYQQELNRFLHPVGADGRVNDIAAPLKVADRSTANHNAAGLLGGGSAVEYLKSVMERGGNGFIAIIRLGCLDIISQRFGLEAVQDCLMAVASFLIHSLHSDDAIFHWSDSSLMAILQGRVSESIINAELQRIVSHNRDITVKIEGRTIMLRIPLTFDLTPTELLRDANDLYKLSANPEPNQSKW